MRGAPHKGLAWRMRRIRSRMFAATSGLPGRRRDFMVQCQAKALRMPTENGVGLNHRDIAPTGPASVQHNPQEPVAAVEAQATRRVLLENCKLVTKREDLRMQGSTRSKSGGYQSEKSDEKRAPRGSHHDLKTDRNPCVFRSDGVFGNSRWDKRGNGGTRSEVGETI